MKVTSARVHGVPWWRRLFSWVKTPRAKPQKFRRPDTHDRWVGAAVENVRTSGDIVVVNNGASPVIKLGPHTDRNGQVCFHEPDAYQCCRLCGRTDQEIEYPVVWADP